MSKESLPNARTSKGMLYGAYIGKLKYLIDQNVYISFDESVSELDNLIALIKIIDSINSKHHVCPKDIRKRIKDFNITRSVQYTISPLVFADTFGLHHHDLDLLVMDLVDDMKRHNDEQLLCVEFIRLLHDILWFKIDKDAIIDILPELDVPESEVLCSTREFDIFFAALWSFVFSDDYASCYEKAANLKDTNSDITGLAGLFAGLYYGLDKIPTDWSEQVFETIGTSLPII